MGLEIDREEFEPAEYDRFGERLEQCLAVLQELLSQPGFGEGPLSLGAELEVGLVDLRARPHPINEAVLRETLDERMTFELDRFNLECNLRHAPFSAAPFQHLRREMESAHAELARAAAIHGGRIAMIGILPTLVPSDLDRSSMTDSVRYRALSRSLRAQRGGPFSLTISGEDPLSTTFDDVTAEGAGTSFQLHLRVPPTEFASVFDAAQLATAPVLAIAGNSPTFLGHRLWEETRVALFKQAVDDRGDRGRGRSRPPRVSFGVGWMPGGAWELFREAVENYPVLLPVLADEDPVATLKAGRPPTLKEIRLHQGTVWHWNRPVYDPHDGGHLRIEFRALPSGPTISDMLANTAFLVGLSLGLAPRMEAVRECFEFESARRNFYRAAQSGLSAQLEWPEPLEASRANSTPDLVRRLVPIAREGLRNGGIADEEADSLLDCILARVERGQTGAAWQRSRLASYGAGRPNTDALAAMLEEYLERSSIGEPVHGWSVS